MSGGISRYFVPQFVNVLDEENLKKGHLSYLSILKIKKSPLNVELHPAAFLFLRKASKVLLCKNI